MRLSFFLAMMIGFFASPGPVQPGEPLKPAEISIPNAPPPRTDAEVQAVLDAAASKPGESTKPIHILLVDGKKDHGPGEHDYPKWKSRWSKLLSLGENVTVDTAYEWPEDEQIAMADVILFFQHGTWNEKRAAAIDKHLEAGKGIGYFHYAIDGRPNAEDFAERIGIAWKGPNSKVRHGQLALRFKEHAISKGLTKEPVRFHDESYWNLVGDYSRIDVIATQMEDGKAQPMVWTYEPPQGGRAFVCILGHYDWTFDDPIFRIIALRGAAWAAGYDSERLTHLSKIGARVND